MSSRPLDPEDVARAVMRSTEDDEPVPEEQLARLLGEVRRLLDDRPIGGFATASGSSRTKSYVLVIAGEEAFLLCWSDALEVRFLGRLPGLSYTERLSARGGMRGFEGDLSLEIEIDHSRLPERLVISVEEWETELLSEFRQTLRAWVRHGEASST